jgi:ATP-binding cassette subfamily B protein
MYKIEYPKITLSDIVRSYWDGSGPWKWWVFLVFVGISAGNVVRVIQPLFYKEFFDVLTTAQPSTDAPILISILMQILFLLTLSWVLLRSSNYLMNKVQPYAMARLKQRAFEHLIQHSINFFANNFVGSMVARVGRFTSAFERITDVIAFNLMPLIVTTIGAIIATLFITPFFALVITAWVVLFLILNYVYAKLLLKHNLEMSELDSKSSGTLADIVSNHGTVTLFSAFKREYERYRKITQIHAEKQRFVWTSNSHIDTVLMLLLIVVEFALFYYSIKFWEQGLLTVGTFVLLQIYVIQIANRQMDFGRVVRAAYETQAAATEMLEIVKLPHEIHDTPGAKPLIVSEGKIELQNVGFNFYKTREVFKDFSLTIRGGEKVAFVGPSGAGKTTLVRLILRLYDTTEGHILIDGQNIQQVTQESLRESIAFVPQDPVLFHRTLMENIRYGQPKASDEEVINAAQKAHCHEFIDILPEKYNTYVGERGVKLSGGERQRVAIARAILKNAPILVLDEATSSLDSESEVFIQDALDVLMQKKTVIVIAHRLSTIRKMDRIIVLANGKIIEDGAHNALLKNSQSIYKKLWELQAGGFIPEEEKYP